MAKINTRRVFHPRLDWVAWYADCGEEGPNGWGATEQDAINDLVRHFPHDDRMYDRVVEEPIHAETPLVPSGFAGPAAARVLGAAVSALRRRLTLVSKGESP